MLFSTSKDVPVRAGPDCWVDAFPGRAAGSVLDGLTGCEVTVGNVNIAVVVFMTLGTWLETFPGAGGCAAFRASSREVDFFPAGGGEAVLESLWETESFFPEIGPEAVLMGLDVVVVFLDGKAIVSTVEAGSEFFLSFGVFGGN